MLFVVYNYKAYDDAQYSYDVDDAMWGSEAHQHRVRRDATNHSNIEMSTSVMLETDSIVIQDDDDASFYDDTDYYNHVYDDAAYDDYQFYSGQSHYNKV